MWVLVLELLVGDLGGGMAINGGHLRCSIHVEALLGTENDTSVHHVELEIGLRNPSANDFFEGRSC